jgi:hypothetical protein
VLVATLLNHLPLNSLLNRQLLTLLLLVLVLVDNPAGVEKHHQDHKRTHRRYRISLKRSVIRTESKTQVAPQLRN